MRPYPLWTKLVLVILTLSPLYYLATHPTHINTALSALHRPSNYPAPDKTDFITRALATQVSDPFNITAIRDLCAARPARTDIVVKCAPGTGGVGNIRSYMLHCTRFAMEAGASIVVPHFHRRAPSDLFELVGDEAGFEHFFDREHYREVLETACPRMDVYDFEEAGWTDTGLVIPAFASGINVSSLEEPSAWRREFDGWIDQWIAGAEGKEAPYVITSNDPGRGRAVLDDGIPFYYNFGRILEFRPDVRRLVAVATYELSQRFKLAIDPSENIYSHAYFGAHVRTSDDAVKAGWNPDFEEQTDHYIAQAQAANVSVIFAAGGNDDDEERFVEKAKALGIHVVGKWDLLSGNDARELENLSWDQRGLFDFEMLLRATSYGGYARSSFSHNIAFRRHFMSAVEDPFADPDDHFADELSRVYGRFDAGWEDEAVRTMWP
ncbi:hypothetical protein MBLNU230_g8537t1 [Neophaeotheca triangularis]